MDYLLGVMRYSSIPHLRIAAPAGAKQSCLEWCGSLRQSHAFWLDINDASPKVIKGL